METANIVSPEQMLEHVQACYVEMLYVYSDARVVQSNSGDEESCLKILSVATAALRSVRMLEEMVKNMVKRAKVEAVDLSLNEMA